MQRALRRLGVLAGLLLVGCGGGGGGPASTSTPVVLDINWSARTRSITAPSSALSAVVSIPGAKVDGTDFSWTINRNAGTNSYSKTYTAPDPAKLGFFTVTVKFYAQADGQGTLVGVATQGVTLEAGHSLGTLIASGTVFSVEVIPNQVVRVHQSTDLSFTAKDHDGNVLVLTPGSASFAQVDGADKLTLAASGTATGKAFGTSSVTATVDGVKSGAVSVLSAPTYTITDLGTLPGDDYSEAKGINSTGQVVGVAGTNFGSANLRAFSWKQGQMTNLGVFSGDSFSTAYAVNDAGVVVGNSTPGINGKAFSWQGAGLTDLSLTVPGAISAVGINNQGAFIGTTLNNTDENGIFTSLSHGFLYSNGQLTRLPIPTTVDNVIADYTFEALNHNGVVAGHVDYQDNSSLPFLLENGAVTLLPMTGNAAFTTGINVKKEVVGTIQASGGLIQPALWSAGQLITLPLPMGYHAGGASSINSTSQIVGTATSGTGVSHASAITWSGTAVVSLDQLLPQNSGWSYLTVANGINDAGQIVGAGVINGQTHAFLMTPQ
jgi:probable HAF family extracellular repeat protein